MKKGFTLIELLAIIIILGIIVLIIVPTASSVVEKVKKNSFESSVENLVRNIKYQCEDDKINKKDPAKTYTISKNRISPKIDVKGKLSMEGTIRVNNKCETTVNVTDGKYVVYNPPGETDASCFDYDTYDTYQFDDSHLDDCVDYMKSAYTSMLNDGSIEADPELGDIDSDEFEDSMRESCAMLKTEADYFDVISSDEGFGWIISGLIETGYIRKTNVTAITKYKCGNHIIDVDDEGVIADNSGSIVDVVVPKTIDGNTINAIGAFAFSPLNGSNGDFDNKNTVGIKSIILPDTITLIDIGAFSDNQLTSITIPSKITSIGAGAFGGNKLTSIKIPNSVISIGEGAFYNNNLTSVIIPNGVTTIGDEAFAFNQLTSVTISNSVTTIGKEAFYSNNLTSLTIPNSVISIGAGAFNRNQLESSEAFIYKRNSDGSIDNSELVSYGGENRDNVAIPNNVTSIGENAFAWIYLTSVIIPDSVETIGKEAFYYNRLTSLTIPNSVTTIGERAFYGNELTSVTIPNSVTSIGSYAFYIGSYSNYYLDTIHVLNPTNVYNWSDITSKGDSTSCTFAIGVNGNRTCGGVQIVNP